MTLTPSLLDDGPWSLSISVSADHDRRTMFTAADLAEPVKLSSSKKKHALIRLKD